MGILGQDPEEEEELWPEADCPPEEIMFPCSCTLSIMLCYNRNLISVRPIFARIAAYIASRGTGEKHFYRLEIDSPSVRRLEANFTQGIKFRVIALKNLRYLESIDPDAFVDTGELKQLSFEGDSSYFVTSRNLPQISTALLGLQSLERLYLDAYQLASIPARVFQSDTLQELSFSYNRLDTGKLKHIAVDAFSQLTRLNTLDLYDQGLDWQKLNEFLYMPGTSIRWIRVD